MKCSIHNNTDATAVCIHCGQALCPGCITKSESGRVVCSATCSAALLRTEQSLNSLRVRSVSSLRAIGYISVATALVVGGGGLMELHNGIPQAGYFLLAMTPVFAISGFVYLRIAKRMQRDSAS